jgi:hypothetical protein
LEEGTRPAWTRDGKEILLGLRRDNRTWRLMRVPAAGGRATFAGLETVGPQQFHFNFDLSPDGKRIVFEGISPAIGAAVR